LATENVETRLATDYETIRRREYELITHLLDVLPKVDNLGEERLSQVRDALFHADHPFLVVLVGPFSSGKSSILNALLGQPDLLTVGPVPTTDRISILRWGEQSQRMSSGGDVDTVFYPAPLLQKVSLVDTPGLESVFQKHEETTRKFLHRADVVLLVMLATQAMTARNLEYLQTLKEFGKKVILVINQADLLTSEEAQSVRDYVLEQSQARLGYKPDVWMVSARQGQAAKSGLEVDKAAWNASGLNKIEDYVDEQLGDTARLRQKLQTPLQITQNVSQAALAVVRSNQAALDHYQSISSNVTQQLAAQKRDQEKTIREINAEISDKFGASAMRGSEAIQDTFRFGNALRSIWGGLLELVGLAGLLRRGTDRSYTKSVFERRKAFEPIGELPSVVDRLPPRLEGKDIQDIDDLVKYARREIDALPPSIRGKVIGNVQPPLQYDRAVLQEVRPALEIIEDEARKVETERIEQSLRNAMLYLAVWEVLLIIFGVVLLAGGSNFWPENSNTPLFLLLGLLGLGVIGLIFMPLRGRMLESAYTSRMLKLQARYIETLTKAADKQLEYGMRLRGDSIQPLTRLVEAQTQIQTEQLRELQSAEQEMVSIESALSTMGKRRLLG
jgi:GTPase Era involved in 16S rRNA processing